MVSEWLTTRILDHVVWVQVLPSRYFQRQEKILKLLTAAGLAQSVERMTAERKVAGSIPGAAPLLVVLKYLRNEGTPFVLQAAGRSRGSDDHVKWRSRLLM